jgi:hypothetical protein
MAFVCIVLLRREVQRSHKMPRPNAGTGAIPLASTGAERVRITAVLGDGYENS